MASEECAWRRTPKNCTNESYLDEVEATLAKAMAVFDGAKAEHHDPEGRAFSVVDCGSIGYDMYHRNVHRTCPWCGLSKTPYSNAPPGEGKDGLMSVSENIFSFQSAAADEWRVFLWCPTCGYTLTYTTFDPM